jgi:NADPH-dependent glutamate synthase beta subunit-like oxidoreductase
MMHFGIPAYRLPRDDLMKEVRQIEAMGVNIVLNHKVEDLLAEKEAGRFDAVFIAIGAGIRKHLEIPARDAERVLDAVSLLHNVTMASGTCGLWSTGCRPCSLRVRSMSSKTSGAA